MVSVIIPAFNEEQVIEKTADTIGTILKNADIHYELIFVDDGSKDKTWEIISGLSMGAPRIRGIRFSRNFGKEAAIMAGLAEAKGDCSVVIDCDLQHPPEKIVEMYRLWEQGYEIVEGVKSDRGNESVGYSIGAKLFYKVISKAAHVDLEDTSDFKLLDKKAVLTLVNLRERNAFFRAMTSWIGFKTTKVEYEVMPRAAGETKWNKFSLIKYAISNVSSFTTAPMQIVTILGFITMVISLIFGIVSLVQKIMGVALEGFTTVILLQLLTSSIIMMSLGVIGYYISRMYEEIKARPKYIVSERTDA
ncbi:MAG: glycosyltransferase family 2 protein [Clostridia bacterium]|nr:glycosyltransferase family 2 protein [Clostridia bacterium]